MFDPKEIDYLKMWIKQNLGGLEPMTFGEKTTLMG